MRDFDQVMVDVRRSPVHQDYAVATRRAALAAAGGLGAGGLLAGAGLWGLAAGGLALPLAGVAVGGGLGWLGWRGLAAHGERAAAADRALFLDALRHARTVDELRAAGFIDPSEFMFDLMPVEEKLDVMPEPGVPMGPECACDEVDLDGELSGIEAAARRLGYGESREMGKGKREKKEQQQEG